MRSPRSLLTFNIQRDIAGGERPAGGPVLSAGGGGCGRRAARATPFPRWSGAEERAGKTVPQQITMTRGNHGDRETAKAQGFFQIIDPTWRESMRPQSRGVDLAKYPDSAIDAPYAVQAAVAQKIPINQWGPKTVAALNAKFRGLNVDETLGEAEAQYGGGGTQVASLDPSDVTAFANPDQPAIPPVSAAAGSTIPRADGGDSTPKGAVGGAHAGAVPQQLAQNGPAWWHQRRVAGWSEKPSAPAAPGPAARPATGSRCSRASVCGFLSSRGW